jgi:hypothetical protein
MKSLDQFLAGMARLGISTPGLPPHRITKRMKKKARDHKRLQPAYGPGTINAKADIMQLCREGRWLEAANMADQHERMCGEQLFAPEVVKQWRLTAIESVVDHA